MLDGEAMRKLKIKYMPEEKSLGEKRVRTTFNPSDNSTVQHIKERAAEFINYVNDNVTIPEEKAQEYINNGQDGEFKRLKALALTSIEEAAMWAVKAATI